MNLHRSGRWAAAILLTFGVLACGGTAAPVPAAGAGANAPADAVERFMKQVEEKNYMAMGWLFGTREGSVLRRDPAAEVERRMYTIATLLEHDRFVIRDETPVPGSTTGEIAFTVQITRKGQSVNVPFTTVRGTDGRWYVEQIGLEAITSQPPIR